MNTKRFMSTALFGMLLISAVQMPVQAALIDWLPVCVRRIFVQGELNNQGTEFANWWGNGPANNGASDADKVMTLGLVMTAAWFGLNYAFDRENSNRATSIFTLFFGVFGALGLQNWVMQNMNQGTQELQRMGVNFNAENSEQREQALNAAGTLYNYFAPAQPAPAEGEQPAQQGTFSLVHSFLNRLFGNPVQQQPAPAPQNNASAAPAAPAQAPAEPNLQLN